MQAYLQQQLNSLIKRQIAIIALVVPTLIVISTGCTTKTSINNKPQQTATSQVSAESLPSTLTIASIAITNDSQQQEQLRTLSEHKMSYYQFVNIRLS